MDGDYKLSSYYMNLMQTATDKELLEYFRRKWESTRFITAVWSSAV